MIFNQIQKISQKLDKTLAGSRLSLPLESPLPKIKVDDTTGTKSDSAIQSWIAQNAPKLLAKLELTDTSPKADTID